MFQKKKKTTKEKLFFESLAADIDMAREKGKNCVYEPAVGEEEDWLWTFVENNNYKCHPSHNTDGVNYYRVSFDV